MLNRAANHDRHEGALRFVMWWDALLSLVAALLCIVGLPVVMFADVSRSIAIVVGVTAILAAIVLAACGIVTAVLIALRFQSGNDSLPAGLRLPLPAVMRPTLRDRS